MRTLKAIKQRGLEQDLTSGQRAWFEVNLPHSWVISVGVRIRKGEISLDTSNAASSSTKCHLGSWGSNETQYVKSLEPHTHSATRTISAHFLRWRSILQLTCIPYSLRRLCWAQFFLSWSFFQDSLYTLTHKLSAPQGKRESWLFLLSPGPDTRQIEWPP